METQRVRAVSFVSSVSNEADAAAIADAQANLTATRLRLACEIVTERHTALTGMQANIGRACDHVSDLNNFLSMLVIEGRAALLSGRIHPTTLNNLKILPRSLTSKTEDGLLAKQKLQAGLPTLRTAWADAHDLLVQLESACADTVERFQEHASALAEAGALLRRCRPSLEGSADGASDPLAYLLGNELARSVGSVQVEATAVCAAIQSGQATGVVVIDAAVSATPAASVDATTTTTAAPSSSVAPSSPPTSACVADLRRWAAVAAEAEASAAALAIATTEAQAAAQAEAEAAAQATADEEAAIQQTADEEAALQQKADEEAAIQQVEIEITQAAQCVQDAHRCQPARRRLAHARRATTAIAAAYRGARGRQRAAAARVRVARAAADEVMAIMRAATAIAADEAARRRTHAASAAIVLQSAVRRRQSVQRVSTRRNEAVERRRAAAARAMGGRAASASTFASPRETIAAAYSRPRTVAFGTRVHARFASPTVAARARTEGANHRPATSARPTSAHSHLPSHLPSADASVALALASSANGRHAELLAVRAKREVLDRKIAEHEAAVRGAHRDARRLKPALPPPPARRSKPLHQSTLPRQSPLEPPPPPKSSPPPPKSSPPPPKSSPPPQPQPELEVVWPAEDQMTAPVPLAAVAQPSRTPPPPRTHIVVHPPKVEPGPLGGGSRLSRGPQLVWRTLEPPPTTGEVRPAGGKDAGGTAGAVRLGQTSTREHDAASMRRRAAAQNVAVWGAR